MVGLRSVLAISFLLSGTLPASAQLPPTATFAAQLVSQYQMAANVTYRTASNQQLKMDVYYRRGATTPNVPNQLITIPGGRHGNFTADERVKIYATIREFLAKNGLAPK